MSSFNHISQAISEQSNCFVSTSEKQSLFCIAGAENIRKLEQAINSNPHIECRLWRIASPHFDAFYCECEGKGLLAFETKFRPTRDPSSALNQSLDSHLLKSLLRLRDEHHLEALGNLSFIDFTAQLEVLNQAVALAGSMTLFEAYCAKVSNTLGFLIAQYKEVINENLYTPYSDDHLTNFAWIYAVVFQVTSEALNQAPAVIHDVATNTGNLPILAAALGESGDLPFECELIECSDTEVRPAKVSLHIAQKEMAINVKSLALKHIDLVHDCSRIGFADVVFAIDVLEHFDSDTGADILKNVWANTGDILIVHVPVEDALQTMYDHKTLYTAEKLRKLASELDCAENLTDTFAHYFRRNPNREISEGFLVLKKTAR